MIFVSDQTLYLEVSLSPTNTTHLYLLETTDFFFVIQGTTVDCNCSTRKHNSPTLSKYALFILNFYGVSCTDAVRSSAKTPRIEEVPSTERERGSAVGGGRACYEPSTMTRDGNMSNETLVHYTTK